MPENTPTVVLVSVQLRGRGLLEAGRDSISHTGQLGLLDTTRPYDYRQSHGDHKVLLIEAGELSLPVDVARSAAPSLRASPIYELVRAHFMRLCENSVELPPGPMAMLGRATVQLIRALITTAADDARQYEALHSTQLLRITMYIDAHLHDPELNADRIAAVHNISPRQLYNVWARTGHDLTPSQWIIQRRLERARNQLTDLDPQVTTIAAIAHGCGFANLSHFSQRFRAAYGMSPREWRWVSRAGVVTLTERLGAGPGTPSASARSSRVVGRPSSGRDLPGRIPGAPPRGLSALASASLAWLDQTAWTTNLAPMTTL